MLFRVRGTVGGESVSKGTDGTHFVGEPVGSISSDTTATIAQAASAIIRSEVRLGIQPALNATASFARVGVTQFGEQKQIAAIHRVVAAFASAWRW